MQTVFANKIGGTIPLQICMNCACQLYFDFCRADVAELADAIDLGSIARKGVEVRVLSSAPV